MARSVKATVSRPSKRLTDLFHDYIVKAPGRGFGRWLSEQDALPLGKRSLISETNDDATFDALIGHI